MKKLVDKKAINKLNKKDGHICTVCGINLALEIQKSESGTVYLRIDPKTRTRSISQTYMCIMNNNNLI